MSDTPRTDAFEKVDRYEWDKYYKGHTDDRFDEFLVYDIARIFERELAAANAEIERLRDELTSKKITITQIMREVENWGGKK